VRGEPLHERGQIVPGELPVERLRDLVPVALELVERACEHAEVGEVVGGSRPRTGWRHCGQVARSWRARSASALEVRAVVCSRSLAASSLSLAA
jgi:hypothetical protein